MGYVRHVAQGGGSAGREPETGRQKEECFQKALAVRKAFVYLAWEGGPGASIRPLFFRSLWGGRHLWEGGHCNNAEVGSPSTQALPRWSLAASACKRLEQGNEVSFLFGLLQA